MPTAKIKLDKPLSQNEKALHRELKSLRREFEFMADSIKSIDTEIERESHRISRVWGLVEKIADLHTRISAKLDRIQMAAQNQALVDSRITDLTEFNKRLVGLLREQKANIPWNPRLEPPIP